jgi:dihydrofolate reductase
MQVSVYIAASLDGFIARRDGTLDWLINPKYDIAGEDFGYANFMHDVDALVMGRGTYDKALEFNPWPYAAKRVVVVTRSPLKLADPRIEVSASAPRELAAGLKAQGLKKIYLDGGQLIQAFLREKLVSDLTITRIPVLIGEGLPLFGAMNHDIDLRHTGTQSWPNGFVQSRYEVI